MTREEQIRNKAIDFSENKDNFLEYDDCGDVCDDKSFIENAFISGAKWADEHSSKQIYTKKQLKEMGFPFTLNGDIVTPNELEEHYRKGIEYRKQKLIDKACEYIRTHVWETVDADEDPIIESICNITKEEFIKDFKRYMDN